MKTYKIVKIPTSLNIEHELKADSLLDVQSWVFSNLDISSRWIVKLNNKTIGEGVQVTVWRGNSSHVKNSFKENRGYFLTKEDALLDFTKHKKAGELRLDLVERRLKQLMIDFNFTIDYAFEGDSQGIYSEDQYIEVREGGFCFTRSINH